MTYTRRPRVKVTAPQDDTWDKVSMPGGHALHYNRAGQPCSLREWTTLFEDHKRRFLGRDYVLGAWVATIYDGVHLDIFEDGPPTMFETTVFPKGRFGRRRTGRELPEFLDQYARRYASEREAREGHWMIRRWVRQIQQLRNGPLPLAVTAKRRRRR